MSDNNLTEADLHAMMAVGVSADHRLHILLPEEFNPQTVAALLAVFAGSVLDTAHAAREAAREADQAIRKAGGKRRLSFSPWLDPPKDESEWN